MQIRKLAATGVLIGATSITLGLASPAAAVCDTYSGACPPADQGGGNTDIGGNEQEPATGGTGTGTDVTQTGGTTGNPNVVSNPATLPFTGGEIALLTALGVGALAGGTALVVAGRRKTSPAA